MPHVLWRSVRLLCALTLTAATIGLSPACSSPTAPSRPPSGTPSPQGPSPALSLTCPEGASGASSGGPVAVSYTAPVVSGGAWPQEVNCSPPSGSTFALGQTAVTCRATDAANQSVSCGFNVTVSLIPRLTRTRFLAFGDSFTAGEVTIPAAGATREGFPNFSLVVVAGVSYPTLLASMLRTRYTDQAWAVDVVNEGKPGEWAEDGAKRLTVAVRKYDPEVLLLLEGINDLSALGQPGVNRALLAIDTMAKEGRSRNARVFLATLPPNKPGPSAVATQILTAFNTGLRSIAAGEGAVLVDLNAALSGDVARYIGVDGMHPTEAGYRRIAEMFADAIRATLEVR
jgi:lysophospholipase L1-like esterase